ncbi:hypothetical protein ACP70R_028479 [Stipagrostis hirtigluma subsp. patula]
MFTGLGPIWIPAHFRDWKETHDPIPKRSLPCVTMGDGDAAALRGGEAFYPSDLLASRLRIRRVHRFLKYHGHLDAAAVELEKATRVFFDVRYLEELMRKGWWNKALSYADSFVPGYRPRTRQALSLLLHLGAAESLASVAAGDRDAAQIVASFHGEHLALEPRLAHCRDILRQMHADQPRAFKLWREVAPYAVSVALDMVARCPELQAKMRLPRNRPMPWDYSSHWARRSHGPRSKAADRTPVDVLTGAFLQQQRSLLVKETNDYSGRMTFNDFSNLGMPRTCTLANLVMPQTCTWQTLSCHRHALACHFSGLRCPSFLALFKKIEQITQKPINLGVRPMENVEKDSSMETGRPSTLNSEATA